jgi:Ni/Fe-hydrogenase subunit HybB-like protein
MILTIIGITFITLAVAVGVGVLILDIYSKYQIRKREKRNELRRRREFGIV